jgi:carboxyl-terminal processing protease
MKVLLITIMLAGIGCATYSQLFVNASGDVQRCSATGQGIIGMATASDAVSSCASSMRTAGYLEIERAGVIGVTLSDSPSGQPVRVLKVANPSPAFDAGVDPGDQILAIDGQSVNSASDARVLLFGEAGTSVTVQFQRADFDTSIAFVRKAFPLVFRKPRPLAR